MNSSKKTVKLTVQAATLFGETICVTGNVPELGRWKVSESIAMTEEVPQSGIWTVSISLPTQKSILFRYIVAVILDSDAVPSQQRIIIRQWETNLKPRKLEFTREHNEIHTFGHYDDQTKIDPGWLTEESVLQFKLYNNPINIWKKSYKDKPIYFYLLPICSARRDSEFSGLDFDDSTLGESCSSSWPVIEISTMTDDKWKFTQQNQFGHEYNPNEYVIFRTQMLYPQTIGYKIDFYCQEEMHPQHIGFCIVLASCLRETTGSFTIPITGKSERPIGQICIEYLLVRPLRGCSLDCSVSYASHWKHNFTQLDVGHRGAGNSRKADRSNTVLENTVAAFNYAASCGADMVELDVQLSKDLIPVIYHDYYICLSTRKKSSPSEHELLEVAVKDLTVEQLKMLKLIPATGESDLFHDEDAEDHQPFPTLEYCLKSVVERAAFNIEIKSPMQLRDGTWELDQRFELNNYVDIILSTIFKHAGRRYIILSCFDPDLCSMVRLKQNRYPLLFLTQGKTEKYPAYLDPRTSSIPMATYFALSTALLGINVHAEELLADRSLISFVKSRNLVLFIWGDDINSPSLITSLKEEGVDGIIYDKVEEFESNKQAVFLMDPTIQVLITEESELDETCLPEL